MSTQHALSIPTQPSTSTFAECESNVQSYARSFPVVFDTAEDAYMFDSEGNRYIDFLAGAGSLNYGHNNPHLRQRLIEYISGAGITHSLDMHTAAKEAFLRRFQDLILAPRKLDYVVQFPGPTGTNAVEAALKLARRVKRRHNIVAFTNGFHGVSLGALAATGNAHHRGAAGVQLSGVTHVPFCDYMGSAFDSIAYLERLLADASSGMDHPAAVIVETVQGEGGLNVASTPWLRDLEQLCRRFDMLLIVDDIQAGCGRTGTFFSFEDAEIRPDIVTLSKSLSGYGIPFAITLFKRELDLWQPGEHNGTFRGNNHAFVTATAALERYWNGHGFERQIADKSRLLFTALHAIADEHDAELFEVRGRGMMCGLACHSGDLARAIARRCFDEGLVIETSGADDQVVKCLPPLTTTQDCLHSAMAILRRAVRAAATAYHRDRMNCTEETQ